MGFQPFKDDTRKQARYSAYLGSQASSQPMELQPLPGQSITDFNAELESFAKAARIFKPMSAAMANRFRTSSGVETVAQPHEGLYQPTDEAYAQHEAKTSGAEKMELEDTPKEHAAKLGMFGTMTREQSDWAPAKLLCKRFRVAPPKMTTSDATGEEPTVTQSYSSSHAAPPLASMDVDASTEGDHIRVVPLESSGSADNGGKRDINNIGLGEDDTQGRETLTYERPAMDIFKAIFASDEEDSDDDTEMKATLEPTEKGPQSGPDSTSIPTPSKLAAPIVSIELGPVDLATFRPTFVARSNKSGLDKTVDKVQKAKKKTKTHGPVSFMDDDDVGLTVIPVVKKRKRDKDQDGKTSKKKRDKVTDKTDVQSVGMVVDEEDDDMWVEKAAPVVSQQIPTGTSTVTDTTTIPSGKSRPRASDFL